MGRGRPKDTKDIHPRIVGNAGGNGGRSTATLTFTVMTKESSVFYHACDSCLIGQHMLYPYLCFCHCTSLCICRFLCEVVCLSIKWTMCTHNKHVIIHKRTELSRTWLPVQEDLKVKFRPTTQKDHRWIQRKVIQPNLLHPCVHLHRFLHKCVQSWTSRSVLFFFTDSHLPLALSVLFLS
jgi:hypothetical protein